MRSPLSLLRPSPAPNLGRELARAQRVMDRMLEDWYEPRFGEVENGALSIATEMKEDDKNYYFKFEMPGFKKDEIKIDVSENRLAVSGERREEKTMKDKDSRVHVSEIYQGQYFRSFELPVSVNREKCEAKYDNGILNLTVPKLEQKATKHIEIH